MAWSVCEAFSEKNVYRVSPWKPRFPLAKNPSFPMLVIETAELLSHGPKTLAGLWSFSHFQKKIVSSITLAITFSYRKNSQLSNDASKILRTSSPESKKSASRLKRKRCLSQNKPKKFIDFYRET